MNAVIAQPQIAADIFPAMPAPRSPRQQYSDGWQAFCNLEPFHNMITEYERKGYLAALDACAETLTPGYAQRMGR